jgi:hypothetical protein
MPDLFAKPLEQVVAEDVRALVGWPESLIVEYKEDLSTVRGGQSAWHTNGTVDQHAKDRLFREIVAFANTSGGHLILGIKETPEKPPAAAAVAPLPNCVDLADRLGKAAQSIDPPIPLLQVCGLPTEPDGSGVVIFRVPPSRRAPHRGPDKDCYVRRDTNSVPVSMRDIQDMTLARGQRDRRVAERFTASAHLFKKWLADEMITDEVGFRITAVPIGEEFDLGRLFGKPLPILQRGYLIETDGTQYVAEAVNLPQSPRPIIRGVRLVFDPTIRATYLDYHSDGSIDFGFRSRSAGYSLPTPVLMAYLIHVLRAADAFRGAASAPGAEYAVEVEMHSRYLARPLPVQSVSGNRGSGHIGLIELPVLLPLLSFGPITELDTAISQIYTDIRDASGATYVERASLTVSRSAQWWQLG